MDTILIFTGILVFFCVIGFLLGLIRGARKSLFRLGVVIISVILAFVLAANLSASIMNTPVSEIPEAAREGLLSMLGDVDPDLIRDATLHDVIMAAMTSSEGIGQLLTAAPSLTNFILGIPQALVAEILFVLFFFLFKLILWLPTSILAAIFMRKKKGKRLLGGAVGALQGVLCACVLLVPIFGLMTTLDAAVMAASELPSTEENEIVTTIADLDEQFYQPLKKDPCYGVMQAVGIKWACNKVYYGLSTVKAPDGSSSCVFRDLNDTIPALIQVSRLGEINMEHLDASDIELLKSLSTSFADAPLIINTLSEVVSNTAKALLEGESFMGIAPPSSDMDPHSAALMNDALSTLANADTEVMKENLPHIIDLFGVLVEYDAMDALSDSEDGLIGLLANEDFTVDLLSTMTKSDILSPVAVSAVNNIGINMIAEALGIPENDAAVYDEMLDQLTQELDKHHNLGGGITVLASKTGAADEREQAKAAVAHILLHYTKGLSENEAEAVASALINTFCTSGTASADKAAIAEKLASSNTAALQARNFKSALVVREDLITADIHVFVDMLPEDRDAEVANLARIIHTASDMVVNLDGGFSDITSQLDFLPPIGKMLNAMEESTLLSNSSEGMLLHFLEMDEVKEVISEKALSTLNNKISEGHVDYEATFSTISAAYRMAESLNAPKNENPDQPSESDPAKDLTSAVEDLFTSMDATSAEIMKDVVDDKFLSDIGIPEEVTESTQIIFSTFFDEVVKNADNENVDYEQEGKAVETIVNIVTNTGSGDMVVEEVINQNTLNAIVSSQTISGTLISISENEDVELNIGEQINEEHREAIDSAINDFLTENTVDEDAQACLDALRGLLGIAK